MAEHKSREAVEAEWWAAWRAADYSWQGLARKSWEGWSLTLDGKLVETLTAPEGSRAATLQDYWRAESSDLIAGDGQFWTRAHCPPAWVNGEPTGKISWSVSQHAAFEEMLSSRLGEASDLEVDGPHRRAQFQGCVLFEAPRHKLATDAPLCVKLQNACFIGTADFENLRFAEIAEFDQALFTRDVNFGAVRFLDDALFYGASFLSDATFEDAQFSKLAYFPLAKFTSEATFARAKFLSSARFSSAWFYGYADFNNAAFSLSADFPDAYFLEASNFAFTAFGANSSFGSVNFCGPSTFESAKFTSDAHFRHATFVETVVFSGAEFGRDAIFSFAAFKAGVWFTIDSAHSRPVTFNRHADFSDAQFSGAARFAGACLKGRMNLRTAIFERYADFSRIVAPDKEANWRGAFDGALFQGTLDWRGVPYHVLSALSGATLERGVLLSRISEGQEALEQGRALTAARSAKDRNDALIALEGGALTLKLAMENVSDKLREQRFYRFELVARRKQQGTPVFEDLFSGLYDFAANYGASIGRPFLLLLVMIPFCALWYWVWEAILARDLGAQAQALVAAPLAPQSWTRVWDALSFSTGRVLPFGPWTTSPPFLAAMDAHGAGWGYGVRFVATAQSVFAIVLAFLFGLAVRRRFQIS